jgi:hypothetical protein
MANTNYDVFDPRIVEIQRRQKLAEMLQQQADQPIDVQQGGGQPAPISWLSVLAKGLQGGTAAYLSNKNSQAVKDYATQQQQLQDQLLQAQYPNMMNGVTPPAPVPTPDVAPPAAASPSGPPPQALAAALASMSPPDASSNTAPDNSQNYDDTPGAPSGPVPQQVAAQLAALPTGGQPPAGPAPGPVSPPSPGGPSGPPSYSLPPPVAQPPAAPIVPPGPQDAAAPAAPQAAVPQANPFTARLDQEIAGLLQVRQRAIAQGGVAPPQINDALNTALAKKQEIVQATPELVAGYSFLKNTPNVQGLMPAYAAALQSGNIQGAQAILKEAQSKGTAQAETIKPTEMEQKLTAAFGPNWKQNPMAMQAAQYMAQNAQTPLGQQQAIETAKANRQNAANITIAAQGGAGVNPTDPKIADYAQNIHNGLVTLRSIPMQYRTAVSSYLANEKDQTGSPTTAALWAGAAHRITTPYTQNPQYQLFAAAQPYLQRMNAAAQMKSSIGDTDLLDSLVKLETGGNAITDAQVLTSINGRSVSDSLNVLKNKLVAQGGVLSDQQRQEAMQLGNKIYDNYKTGYQPLYQQASKQLQGANIPKAYWTIPDLNQLGPGLGSGGNASHPQDSDAVTWAKSHPNDPRAAKILQLNGAQ